MDAQKTHTIFTILLLSIGIAGVLISINDRKETETLYASYPADAIKRRDNQYLFMSLVVLMAGVFMKVHEHK